MIQARTLTTLVAIGALAALPGCSMFGGGNGGGGLFGGNRSSSQYSQAPSSNYNTAGNYGAPSSVTGTNATMAPVSPDMIRKVQSNLKQNGDYKGRVDGVWGPQSEAAMRRYQQSHNLTASGEIDMQTLQAMNITAENSNQYGQGNANPNNPNNQPNYSTGPNAPSGTSHATNMPYPNDNNGANNTNNPNNPPGTNSGANNNAGNTNR